MLSGMDYRTIVNRSHFFPFSSVVSSSQKIFTYKVKLYVLFRMAFSISACDILSQNIILHSLDTYFDVKGEQSKLTQNLPWIVKLPWIFQNKVLEKKVWKALCGLFKFTGIHPISYMKESLKRCDLIWWHKIIA